MSQRGLIGRVRESGIRFVDPIAAVALTVGALLGVAGMREHRHVAFAIAAAVACTASVGWRRRFPVPMAFLSLSGLLGYQLAAGIRR